MLADLQDYDATVGDQVLDELLAKCEERWSHRMSWALTRMRQWVKRRAAPVAALVDLPAALLCPVPPPGELPLAGRRLGVIHARLTDDVAARITNRLSAIARGLDDPRDDRSLTRSEPMCSSISSWPVRGPRTSARTPRHPSSRAGAKGVAIVMTLETLLSLTDDPAGLPGGLPGAGGRGPSPRG